MKKGFTLAETLVALAIIGVIAGIMIPAVQNVRPNKEMVMFKKAYYLAGKNISEIVNDESLYPETDDPETFGLANTEKVQFRGNWYQGNTKFCGLLAAKLNTTCNGGSFTTADGMVWTVRNSDFRNGQTVVRVDVNGGNVECSDTANCTKPDQFRFVVNKDGRIRPDGYLAGTYLLETDNTKKANDFDVKRNVALQSDANIVNGFNSTITNSNLSNTGTAVNSVVNQTNSSINTVNTDIVNMVKNAATQNGIVKGSN